MDTCTIFRLIIILLIIVIVNIHKYLMKKVVNDSSDAKCLSLNNKQYLTQRTLISLHRNEYSQGLCYYPFVINLDRCVESFNIFNNLFNRVFVRNKKIRFKSTCFYYDYRNK